MAATGGEGVGKVITEEEEACTVDGLMEGADRHLGGEIRAGTLS